MPPAPQNRVGSVLNFLLIFAIAYVGSQLIMRWVFPPPPPPLQAGSSTVVLSLVDATIRGGHFPIVQLENRGTTPFMLNARCPEMPFEVFEVMGEEGQEKVSPISATENVVPCEANPAIAPGATARVSLAPWKYSAFGHNGTYELRLAVPAAGTGAITSVTTSARFEIYEPGITVKTFRAFVSRPFLNFLVLVASLLPDHNLGIAIIVLTLVVKLLLFFPTQHALESQRRMQQLQPKIEEIRARYKEDAVKMQQETMALWKENKVNPFSSLLPLIIQLPLLIGLYIVVRDGIELGLARDLLYPVYDNLPWGLGTNFFGLDLAHPNAYVMAPIVMGFQYFQMRLSFAHAKKKRAANKVIDVDPKTGKPAKESMSPEVVQQQVMMYALPLMIGFFTLNMPAAVSLYWAVSTLFAIGQQFVVNKRIA